MSQNSVSPSPSRFAATLLEVMDTVSYRRVDLADVLDPVYRLRYEAYRREDFIPINSQRIAGDKYDNAPNAYCFGVYIQGQLASSIRFHLVTPDERASPSRSIYPEILDPMLDSGKIYLDPSRFTADHEASLAFPALPFLTTRLIVMASDYFNVDYCLSSVRPEHGAFYKRVFHSECWGDVRYYDGLQFPVRMYVADVPKVLPSIYARYPSYRASRQEMQELFSTGQSNLGRYIAATARAAVVARAQEQEQEPEMA